MHKIISYCIIMWRTEKGVSHCTEPSEPDRPSPSYLYVHRVSTAFRLSSYSPRPRAAHCFYNKVDVVIFVFGIADDRVLHTWWLWWCRWWSWWRWWWWSLSSSSLSVSLLLLKCIRNEITIVIIIQPSRLSVRLHLTNYNDNDNLLRYYSVAATHTKGET